MDIYYILTPASEYVDILVRILAIFIPQSND